MSLVKTFDKYVAYRAVRDALTKEEIYNKNKNTISGLELFHLFQERYDLMGDILMPIREIVSKEVNVKNMYFTTGLNDDISIIIEYIVNGVEEFVILSKFDNEKIEIMEKGNRVELGHLIDDNQVVVDDAIKQGYDRGYNIEYQIPNVNKQILFKDCGDDFGVQDVLGKVLNLTINYAYFKNNHGIQLTTLTSPHGNLLKYFSAREENVAQFLSNVKVYEENVPSLILRRK